MNVPGPMQHLALVARGHLRFGAVDGVHHGGDFRHGFDQLSGQPLHGLPALIAAIRGNDVHQPLAGAFALADHQKAPKAGMITGGVRGQPGVCGPTCHEVSDGIAFFALQQAGLQRQSFIEPAAHVQAKRKMPVLERLSGFHLSSGEPAVRTEREFHLVAVEKRLRRGQRRKHRHIGKATDVLQHFLHLSGFDFNLPVVFQMLQRAAAAVAEIHALRFLVIRTLPQHIQNAGIGVGFFLAGDFGAHPLTRQGALDEHHHAVHPADAVCSKSQAFNFQFDLSALFQASHDAHTSIKMSSS